MLGNDLILSSDKAPLYAAKSCDISVECDTKEYASETSARWRTFLADRKSWSVSCSYLVNNTSIPADASRVGDTFTLTVTPRDDEEAGHRVAGTAICTQWRVTGTRGNLVQGSFSFQGTGPLA